ncbi:MAG: HEPN domain-containing protein [Microcella pacifica]|uniref:HEPN domain-containing protein n=1 Tax=Microcella pacifica TaxID=2591847 RepID=A0A9E5JPB6_9MICO|nr:HEPN domain-containing protein [Microcella pacifica]MBR22190.1 hypothetical protein [Leifsonia sp.]MBU1251207.1 HEPN domain-containing protein [Actinomycetota bacterium]MBU1608618.1 HEPN domain-containing protein [Actinomycetota bacterium]MBU2316676.1 HEPN domain-containing protein [Actinomycetota bacterium]NHF63309.1 HEPN domain-containing protein [Microcella pacifica]
MTWEQGQATIEQLLHRGELETVTAQPEFAERSSELCETHIVAARMIVGEDPVGALALAYDAARKVFTSLLLAQGIRPTRSGGHIAVTEAASAQLDPPNRIGRQVDRPRRARNDNEYPSVDTPSATADDARDAIAVAQEAVRAARLVLPHLTPF